MTSAQRALLNAARDAHRYFDRKAHGLPMRGMHEVITIGRDLTATIDAVERELAEDQAALCLAQMVDRR